MSGIPQTGKVLWMDLTVDDAVGVRAFYERVAGWTSTPVEMDGYQDFCMNADDGSTSAGICHAKGNNGSLPAVWLIYITVEDVVVAASACEANGGKVLQQPRNVGNGLCAVLQDPAGAPFAIYQEAESS